MAWEGATLGAQGGDARRLLLSRLVIEHRLAPQDPLSLNEIVVGAGSDGPAARRRAGAAGEGDGAAVLSLSSLFRTAALARSSP